MTKHGTTDIRVLIKGKEISAEVGTPVEVYDRALKSVVWTGHVARVQSKTGGLWVQRLGGKAGKLHFFSKFGSSGPHGSAYWLLRVASP